MNFINNRRWLGKYFRDVLEVVRKQEGKESTGEVLVEPSRKNLPTLKMTIDGTMKYVHSKYDPMSDVDRLLKQYSSELEGGALFFGVGLGYHIDEFIKRYPNKKIAIIEPNEEVFLAYIKHSQLAKGKHNNILGIHVGIENIQRFMNKVFQKSKGQLQLISLQHYDDLYANEWNVVRKMLVAYLKDKKSSLAVNLSFQNRWTANVIKNFPSLLETPNILYNNQIDNDNQVAILVAAGPSLDYEIENLRKIKEDNSAHIFSVGSAINALIENDIHPHATLSYDPTDLNEKVVQKVKEENIKDIPLIYGSSVGYEVLEGYPGEMYHMIMSQDKLSGHLLQAKEEMLVLYDAASIAVVTLQLLIHLGFKKIVLVGQNLGYTGDYRYAKGIKYDHSKPKLTDDEIENQIIYTMDVEGNEIRTKEMFERMKRQYEAYIVRYKDVEVINTTVGGAKIKGTEYKRLQHLIDKGYFTQIQENQLFNLSNEYHLSYTEEKLAVFIKDKEKIVSQLEDAIDKLKDIQKATQLNRQTQLEKLFGLFDKAYANIERNYYYQFVLKSSLRVQFEQLTNYIAEIKYEDDLIKKAYIIMDAFNTYLNVINKQHHVFQPYFDEMVEKSTMIIEQRMEEES